MTQRASTYLKLGIALTLVGPFLIVFIPEWLGQWMLSQDNPDIGYWIIQVLVTMMRWSITPLGVGLILASIVIRELGDTRTRDDKDPIDALCVWL